MSNILTPRIVFKPFQYQWAYDYWFKQQCSHWMHHEISMGDDVIDWSSKLGEHEKNVVGNILKGFAQTEVVVNDYWTQYVTKWFPVPEIKMMATVFGSTETIHSVAYSYLNDTLGLDDFSEFLSNEETMNRLNVLTSVDSNDVSLPNIARSLAIFSAAAEGVQLYSAFAVLLSFKRRNLLRGISQQMIFSIRDESLHSEAGCKLFRVLCEENQGLKERVQDDVVDGIGLAVSNELEYIDWIFGGEDIDTISSFELKNFIFDRANRKLEELGYESQYDVDLELLNKMSWFYHLTSGEIQSDFFSGRETSYSKENADWLSDILW